MNAAARWPDRLVVRPWTPGDARRVAAWRYGGPWQVYDLPGTELPGATGGCLAVAGAADGRLVGFYCTGDEARVPGLAAEFGVVDLGAGMDPRWVGRGNGAGFGRVVLADLRRDHPTAVVRAVVQSWNTRSLRLLRTLGFLESGRHVCVQNSRPVEYVVVLLSPR
ncbi:GNAT family N-acetyltransferase [Nocardia fusca]|uniref:GNAT family N-acetyltransferase n=1 Tax=Nocardia fusca TaxID=941183 RepID=UPI0007A744AE|nr:GNAT family N-acetyltransferase [Nocardia fusca]